MTEQDILIESHQHLDLRNEVRDRRFSKNTTYHLKHALKQLQSAQTNVDDLNELISNIIPAIRWDEMKLEKDQTSEDNDTSTDQSQDSHTSTDQEQTSQDESQDSQESNEEQEDSTKNLSPHEEEETTQETQQKDTTIVAGIIEFPDRTVTQKDLENTMISLQAENPQQTPSLQSQAQLHTKQLSQGNIRFAYHNVPADIALRVRAEYVTQVAESQVLRTAKERRKVRVVFDTRTKQIKGENINDLPDNPTLQRTYATIRFEDKQAQQKDGDRLETWNYLSIRYAVNNSQQDRVTEYLQKQIRIESTSIQEENLLCELRVPPHIRCQLIYEDDEYQGISSVFMLEEEPQNVVIEAKRVRERKIDSEQQASADPADPFDNTQEATIVIEPSYEQESKRFRKTQDDPYGVPGIEFPDAINHYTPLLFKTLREGGRRSQYIDYAIRVGYEEQPGKTSWLGNKTLQQLDITLSIADQKNTQPEDIVPVNQDGSETRYMEPITARKTLRTLRINVGSPKMAQGLFEILKAPIGAKLHFYVYAGLLTSKKDGHRRVLTDDNKHVSAWSRITIVNPAGS